MKWKMVVFGGVLTLIAPLLLIILLLMVIGGDDDSSMADMGGTAELPLSDAVLAHRPAVEKYCKEFGISDYIDYIFAIMQVESGGDDVKYPDVMQSSESLGLSPNTLNTEDSIRQGCKYFSELVASAQKKKLDMDCVTQSYNYGGGFLNYVFKNGKHYSFDLARNFSNEKSRGQTVPYQNPIAVSVNGGWRYTYGNMFYVKLVNQYLPKKQEQGVGTSTVMPDGVVVFENGWAFPVLRNYSFSRGMSAKHGGFDIAAPPGTPIVAAQDGVVETVQKWNGVVTKGDMNSYGNMVYIKHPDGTKTRYAHCTVTMVSVGQEVKRGQQVGTIGSTGNSTGPHLHFEYFLNGKRSDPAKIIRMP